MPKPLTIATWNVNSIKQRVDAVVGWLEAGANDKGVDVLLLQEIKCEEEAFPSQRFREIGYEVLVVGQKAYNGVAVVSRLPMTERCRALPDDAGDATGGDATDGGADTQARYLEVEIEGVIVACLYAPNGNPLYNDDDADDGAGASQRNYSEKFAYKLGWLDRLVARAQALNGKGVPVVLGGDFNVIPDVRDCYDWAAWRGDALAHPESLKRWRRLLYGGFADGWRAGHPHEVGFSFWDYQGGAWQKDLGLRIDHLLVNAEAGDRLVAAEIDRAPRGEAKASDHTPVVGRFGG